MTSFPAYILVLNQLLGSTSELPEHKPEPSIITASLEEGVTIKPQDENQRIWNKARFSLNADGPLSDSLQGHYDGAHQLEMGKDGKGYLSIHNFTLDRTRGEFPLGLEPLLRFQVDTTDLIAYTGVRKKFRVGGGEGSVDVSTNLNQTNVTGFYGRSIGPGFAYMAYTMDAARGIKPDHYAEIQYTVPVLKNVAIYARGEFPLIHHFDSAHVRGSCGVSITLK